MPTMDNTTTTLNLTESFPKRIRSVSARLFSMNNISDLHQPSFSPSSSVSHKRTSCQLISSSSSSPVDQHIILNPSKWFPRIRCRSSSSASSTFSLVFSSSSTTTFIHSYNQFSSSDNHLAYQHLVSLDTVSSELEDLYRTAKEEIEYAIESQGSIYYEGDKVTAHAAFELCETKYDTVMQMFGDTANSIKFRFRWETDLHQLRLTLNSLPQIHHSIYD